MLERWTKGQCEMGTTMVECWSGCAMFLTFCNNINNINIIETGGSRTSRTFYSHRVTSESALLFTQLANPHGAKHLPGLDFARLSSALLSRSLPASPGQTLSPVMCVPFWHVQHAAI